MNLPVSSGAATWIDMTESMTGCTPCLGCKCIIPAITSLLCPQPLLACMHALNESCIDLFVQSVSQSVIHSFIHSSYIHAFMHSTLIHPFIWLLIHAGPCIVHHPCWYIIMSPLREPESTIKVACGLTVALQVWKPIVAACRHYTFYIWKDIFARSPAARYALIPLYAYSGWSIWTSVTAQQSKLCALLMTLCTVVTLVPAWLIEFR